MAETHVLVTEYREGRLGEITSVAESHDIHIEDIQLRRGDPFEVWVTFGDDPAAALADLARRGWAVDPDTTW
jgi:hypothetical protein